ncbi:arylsulfatase [Sediminitomix flava]|uniref:Arylsulfatase n=1 Tax=Sediminitomix flava TaxID=379075 RepID=A0A315Z4P6_SEDFL|nr:arylsulfatase [Sediminitomix flava]PWJ37998.1 arylsulfatase [Sediminitomix flava]
MKQLSLFFISLFLIKSVYAQKDERPNIILILADDMGYSDIGCYGGEIPTPNLDALADNGILLSSFYNTARCCPTRASLMTGLFPHQTGIGQMTNSPKGDTFKDWGTEGYIGYLNKNCVTIAEVLKESGYSTYMTGKWHLGYHDKSRWPLQRGFDKFYGSISGATSYFYPNGKRPVMYMNEVLPPPDSTTYYTTDAFTDYAIQFIDEHESDNPFFLYLAYTAPHWPLHAKDEDIKKFVGKFTKGWDQLRKERFERMVKMGLMDKKWGLSERDHRVRAWEEVDDKQQVRSDYRMAVYAAQVFCMDYNIGKVVEKLKTDDELDNTLILFLSDNGACAEPYQEFGGKPDSFINKATFSGAVSYGISWSNLSNTPFHEYKVKTYEGGISTPLIAHWPAKFKKRKGKIVHQPHYLIDIMPTILEASEARYPKNYHQGNNIHNLEGISLLPLLSKGKGDAHEYMFWEHQSNCAVRKGDWKAIKKLNDKEWQLFNLKKDRIESDNCAKRYPEIVEDLAQNWEKWAKTHYVLPKRISKKETSSNQ